MRRTSQKSPMDGRLKADPRLLRQSSQKLLDAIDSMMWALQNMPDGEGLRDSLVECKTKLGVALESIGYTMKVRPGFKTVVTKIRQPRETAEPKNYPFPLQPETVGTKIRQPRETAEPKNYPFPLQSEMSMAARAATRIIVSSEIISRTQAKR